MSGPGRAVLVSAPDVPTMADPAPSVEDLPAPRRVAIAGLFREILRTEDELAGLYASGAQRFPIPYLRQKLEELAEMKRARAAALTRLGPGLDADAGAGSALPAPPAVLPAPPERRAGLFARAFEAERTLQVAYREVLVLLDDPARCPDLPALAASSPRHRALLRDLYLRYS